MLFENQSAGSHRKNRHRELYEMTVADEQPYGTSAPTSSPTSSPTHATMLMLSAANSVTQADKEDSRTGRGDVDKKKETLKKKDTKVDDGLYAGNKYGNTQGRDDKNDPVQDSSSATVLAMASGYGRDENRNFVGSL